VTEAKVNPAPRRSRWRVVLWALPLFVLIGGAATFVGCHLWARHHFQAAKKAAEQRRFDEARDHLALCLKVWPRDPEVHLLAARTAWRAGAMDEAELHLERCRELGGTEEALSLERLLMRVQSGDADYLAGYLFRCVQQDHPDATTILEALFLGYYKTFQLPRAWVCLDLLLEREPENVQALVWRGEVLHRLYRKADALSDLRKAVNLDPERDDARLLLADLLLDRKYVSEALEHYQCLAERQPRGRAVRLGLARCHVQIGETPEAVSLLDELLTEDPRDGEALRERGQLTLDSGQVAEAEKWLRRALEAAPYDRETVFNLAKCLESLDQKDEAARLRKKLDRIDADLARLKELSQQIAESPRDPEPRCEAGRIMLRNGLEQEGLRWLRSAQQLDADHAATRQALADYFQGKGTKAKVEK
jgi:predicted Zn-dependent protease